ncbi:MAG: hypothetical protein H6R07_3289 [Proteobacteria bacterium]|nr:hypothetical protein [Pseudomonadota bacterium]
MSQIIRSTGQSAEIIEDPWYVVRDPAGLDLPGHAHRIIPFQQWRALLENGMTPGAETTGVWLSPDDEFQDDLVQLIQLPLLAIDFPSFRDGRGYSIAYLLRTRCSFTGELRAIGDVLRDQLFYMQRCGFNSFAVRADKDIHDALKGLTTFSVKYQGAVDDPVPLFRKREQATLPDEAWEP